MDFEEEIKILSTIARRIQLQQKQLHDLYWEIDTLTQKMMTEEVKKQQAAEKAAADTTKGGEKKE